MNKDIYKKGLILLAIIVIVLITVFGYVIDANNDKVILPNEEEQDTADDEKDEESKEDVQEISTIVVDINGAVKNPGIYELKDGMRVNDAIEAAGGLTEEVNTEYLSKNINKARILCDEEKLYIPKIGDDISLTEADNNEGNGENAPIGKININTATKNQLVTLKGIGETFAQRIIDYRKNKKFSSTEDIKNVKGIGDKTFEQIKDYITVE